MAYIYNADIYCDECGEELIAMLIAKDVENTGDSDDYPQSCDDDEETDSPQHCGSGKDCLNAITLSNGDMVGCLIGTNLTGDGVEYVKEYVKEGGIVATEIWREEFDWIDFDD